MTTTEGPDVAFLLVRAWRHPDGPLCTRVTAVVDHVTEPTQWEVCAGVDSTLRVVKNWLQRLEVPAASGPISEHVAVRDS